MVELNNDKGSRQFIYCFNNSTIDFIIFKKEEKKEKLHKEERKEEIT